jgi:chorismate mutase
MPSTGTTSAALFPRIVIYWSHEREIESEKEYRFALLVATVRMKTIAILLLLMPLLTADTKAGTQDRLEACRQQIDSLDQRLVEMIQERARVVQQVGAIKREAHLPVTDTGRERRLIQKAEELAKGGPLPPEAVGRIYQKLVEEMRNWEAGLKRDQG